MQNIKIGLRIKQRREMLDITQEELAKRMGYKSKSTINKIEKCINDVAQSNVINFAKALNTSEAFLMGCTDDPNMKVKFAVQSPEELLDNLNKAIPTTHISISDDIVNDDVSPEVEQALELYKLYKSATPQVQKAVEVLLKPAESQT